VCPQSGDAAAGLSALVYGAPAPWQVTVLPSPGCQVTETGVAVAVTLSPGTVAVFDLGTHSAGLIHSQVGRFVSCKAAWAGLERITGLGSPRVWRARAASTAGFGGAGRAGEGLHGDLAAGRDAAERLVHRALAAAWGSSAGRGAGRRAGPGCHIALRRVRLPARHAAVRGPAPWAAAGQRGLLPAGQQQDDCQPGRQQAGKDAAQHDPAFSTTRYVTFQVPSNGCTCA
jgi:hypothetical protein